MSRKISKLGVLVAVAFALTACTNATTEEKAETKTEAVAETTAPVSAKMLNIVLADASKAVSEIAADGSTCTVQPLKYVVKSGEEILLEGDFVTEGRVLGTDEAKTCNAMLTIPEVPGKEAYTVELNGKTVEVDALNRSALTVDFAF